MPVSDRPLLHREAIVAAARELIVADGLEALSLRRLAARLGVTAPALYAHVRDKQDLLRAVAESGYTAMTPAPRALPWDGRGNHAGTLHFEGSAASSGISVASIPKAPELHTTALHVAALSMDGAILIEPVQGVQVGFRGSYTSYDWTRETAFGTMPMPNKPSLFGLGPEVRIWLPFDRDERFALGIAGNVLHYDIPFAEWTRADCVNTPDCAGTPTFSSGGASYVLTHQSSEPRFVWNLGLYPSFGLGAHAGVTYNLSERWTLGSAFRSNLWFLPKSRTCSAIGDCATITGRVVALELAFSVGYRIPL